MRRLRPVVAVGVAQAALGLVLGSLGPYLVLLAAELDRPRSELAWLASGFGAGLVAVAATGRLLLRLGADRLLRMCTAALAVGASALAVTPLLPSLGPSSLGPAPLGLVPVAAGALAFGLGGAGVVLATPVLLAGPGMAGRVSVVTGVSSVGGLLGPVLVGTGELAAGAGPLALLLPVPALLVVAGWRPGPPAGSDRGVERAASGSTRGPARPAPRVRTSAVAVTVAWWQVVLAVSAEFCYLLWGAARLQDAGAAAGLAALLSSGFLVGMAAGRLAGTRLADRSLARPACLLLAGTGTALVVAAADPWLVAAGLLLAGLGLSLLYPLTLAALVAVPALPLRTATSLGALASGTAVLTAPTALGLLDGVVSLQVAFLLPLAVLALLAALALPALRHR